MAQNLNLNPNYKILIRVKPFEAEQSTISIPNNQTLNIKELPQPGREHIKTSDIQFKFDNVIDPKTQQQEFFDNIKDIYVNHLLNGQSASIISYGPSQGGKSFTIFGEDEFFTPGDDISEGQSDRMGLVARTCEYILKKKQDDKDINIELSCHFVDVYMDKLRDLGKSLEKGQKNSKNDTQQQQLYENEDMEITENLSGNSQVKNLKKINILSINDIYDLLRAAFKFRSKSQTKFNNLQTKTHTIFTLNLEIYDKNFGQRNVQLHFVDLAGAEKIQKNNNDNQKFQESVTISCNHLILSKCLQAFAYSSQTQNLPAKECKLTRYMQNTFNINSLIMLIVNIEPQDQMLHENLISIHYAERTKNIEFQSQLLDQQLNMGQSQGMEKAIRAINNEVSEIQKKIDANHKDYTFKLTDLQRQLDLNIDLNELATHPQDKDIQMCNQMRDSQNKLINLKQNYQEVKDKIKKINGQMADYQQDQKKIQENMKKNISNLLQSNNQLKNQISLDRVSLESTANQQIKVNIDEMNLISKKNLEDLTEKASVLVNRQDNLQIQLEKFSLNLKDINQKQLIQQQYLKTNVQKVESEYQKNYKDIQEQFQKQYEQKEKILQKFIKDFKFHKENKKQEIQQAEAELLQLHMISNKQKILIENAIKGNYTNGLISISIPQKELPIKKTNSKIMQKIIQENKLLCSEKYTTKKIGQKYMESTYKSSEILNHLEPKNIKENQQSQFKQSNLLSLVNITKLDEQDIQHFCQKLFDANIQCVQRIEELQKQHENQQNIKEKINIEQEIQDKEKFQKSYLKEWKQNNKSKIAFQQQKDLMNIQATENKNNQTNYSKVKYGII